MNFLYRGIVYNNSMPRTLKNRGILNTATGGLFGKPAGFEQLGDQIDVPGPTDPTAQITAELSKQFSQNCTIEVCATITENEGIWTTILTPKNGSEEIEKYLGTMKKNSSVARGGTARKKTRSGKRRKRGKSRRRGKRS